MSDLSTKVLRPEETGHDGWVAVVEGWHIRADNQAHAERIISACNMSASIGRKQAQNALRMALGFSSYSNHIGR